MKLSERGDAVLTGRLEAQKVRASLREELLHSQLVTLDFAGIEGMSPSFADEIFVRLVADVGADRVRFENLSGHLQQVAATVQRRRA